MRWQIFLLMMVVVLPLSYAELCEDVIRPDVQCEMVTPTMFGSNYDYIILKDGLVNETGTMQLWSNGSYYFNFSKSNGTYIIKTAEYEREVFVRESEVSNMAVDLSIIIGIIAFIGIFLFIAFKLDESHWVLKTVITVFSIFLILLIPRYLFSVSPSDLTSDLVKYSVRMIYLFVIYIVMYLLWKFFKYYGKTESIERWFEDNFKNKNRES